MAGSKATKPAEEVEFEGDDSMPEWKRLSIERSLQGPRREPKSGPTVSSQQRSS